MEERGQETPVPVCVAARRVRMSAQTIRRYIRNGLVCEVLTEVDLAEVRRIRRLTDLGVNLAGVEIILNMRGQIMELRREIARLERMLADLE